MLKPRRREAVECLNLSFPPHVNNRSITKGQEAQVRVVCWLFANPGAGFFSDGQPPEKVDLQPNCFDGARKPRPNTTTNTTTTMALLNLTICVLVLLFVALEVDAVCLPVNRYDWGWNIYIGKTGMTKKVPCAETSYTSHQCCQTESRTRFDGCELADDSREVPQCWGKNTIRVCCTEGEK